MKLEGRATGNRREMFQPQSVPHRPPGVCKSQRMLWLLCWYPASVKAAAICVCISTASMCVVVMMTARAGARVTDAVWPCRPKPLYYSTASQLGLHKTRGIPNLLDFVLPRTAPHVRRPHPPFPQPKPWKGIPSERHSWQLSERVAVKGMCFGLTNTLPSSGPSLRLASTPSG